MRRKTKDKLLTLTEAFYDLFKVGAFVTLAALLSNGQNAPMLYKKFSHFSLWRIKQMLRKQKLRGLIRYDEEDERSPILLTTKGFYRVTSGKLSACKEARSWDHLWRLIIFDIPERTKGRDRFRRLIKKIGCHRIQRSVYVYPYDCKKDLLSLAANLRISSHVSVLTVPDLGQHERRARKYYFREFN